MWYYLETQIGDGKVSRKPVFYGDRSELSDEEKKIYDLLKGPSWNEMTLVSHRPFDGLIRRYIRTDAGIFPHICEEHGCTTMVQFDDEPRCFTHSPDEGSSVHGWSARALAMEES